MNACKRLAGIILTASLLLPVPALSRELATAPESMHEAELAGFAALPDGSGAAVGLRVREPDRMVPIFIGVVEAAAIARAEQGVRPPRPMTHELLGDLLAATDVQVLRLVIDDLREGIYHAAIEVRDARGRLHWVDTRPSDGLVLAVRHGIPILLAPAVLASAPEPDMPTVAPSQPVLTRI